MAAFLSQPPCVVTVQITDHRELSNGQPTSLWGQRCKMCYYGYLDFGLTTKVHQEFMNGKWFKHTIPQDQSNG